MRKRLFSFILTLIMTLTSVANLSVFAATDIYYDGEWHRYNGNFFTLKVNGTKLDCSVPPIVFHDYSVVPARDVFEHLGAMVVWYAPEERVTINYEGSYISLFINNTQAYHDGAKETMPIAPKIINGKTMIPVRYVAESLGFDVSFDATNDTIHINTKGTTKSPQDSTPKPSTPTVSGPTLLSCSCTENNNVFSAVLKLSKSGATYNSFTLDNPDRIVVDVTGASLSGNLSNQTPNSSMVSAVRFGQQENAARIVFDMKSSQKYNVSVSGDKLLISIGSSVTPGVPSTAPSDPVVPEIVIPPSRSITIDPGHGGSDPGAIFKDENDKVWEEADINLAVSLKVRDILEANGVRVVMTRTTDEYVVRRDRPELANSEKTALFLSIHTNSVENAENANGIETWGSLETGVPLAGVTDKSFAQNVQKSVIAKTGATNRGIKDSVTLTVLVYSVMPSVLIEVGFISNEEERAKMFTESYRNKLAQGIAEGILKTFDDMGV